MSISPEPLDLRSHTLPEDKTAELLRLFPEIRTEDGRIDFDRLKLVLGETVDVGKERYGLTWPGKADCFKTIQAPSEGTLLPCPEESVNFDTTENLIIEGDNLEVLKLLQKSYQGRVKMIYIDPPYNTGNDFIYPDNYTESLRTYLEYTGQVDAQGKKFGTNSDTEGRFHSRWLNMMYPRLYLARNLLRDDGVIFVSIDDHELDNLLKICNELFGEENAVGIICWKNVTDNNPTLINKDNEFIICFAKNIKSLPKAWKSYVSDAKETLLTEYERLKAQNLTTEQIQESLRKFIADNAESIGLLTRYKFVDQTGVFTGSESVHNTRPGGYDFEVFHPITNKPMKKPANGYRFPEPTFRNMEKEGVIIYGDNEEQIVKIKKYLKDYEDTLRSVLIMDGRLGSYDLKRVFGNDTKVFSNPKPVDLIKSLVSYVTEPNDIVFDFFAGSGTIAHSILELNQKDGGNRKFILVQLPEPLDPEAQDQRAAYNFCISSHLHPNIAEITKERVRRVIKKLGDANDGRLPLDAPQDRGFRVFKLARSGFKPWDAALPTDAAALQQKLDLHVDHILHGRTELDLLTEILLKSGFPLTTPVETLTLAGKTVYRVAGGALLVCLDRDLNLELIRLLAAQAPERVVLLDAGFNGQDALKTNAVHIFKDAGVPSFKTV